MDRRAFIRHTAALGAAAALPSLVRQGAVVTGAPDAARARAARVGSELRIGVIGCGGRGTGAAANALEASPDSRITAVGDLFDERIASCLGHLTSFGGRAEVAQSNRFVGFQAFEGVLRAPCDVVILATPPGFRPQHFAAAVDAGKHVFLEKPVAVDGTGIRAVLAAAARADERRLAVVAGTQRRHETSYREAMERIRGGAIGDIIAARVFWNMGSLWHRQPDPARSDVENQIRNWLYHTWLSGDHIVEQHVHNIDVANWALDANPVRCVAVGGRQVRTDPASYGHIFDHFAVDFEYPPARDGAPRFVLSMARQQDGTAGRVEEVLRGTRGMARLAPGFVQITGESSWAFAGPDNNPYVQEHVDLHAAIRSGTPLNEAHQVAHSTLAAIMGRTAAYTGAEVSWEQALNDPVDLFPRDLQMGPLPQATVPMPGRPWPPVPTTPKSP
jgi:predicted dehydrogenase